MAIPARKKVAAFGLLCIVIIIAIGIEITNSTRTKEASTPNSITATAMPSAVTSDTAAPVAAYKDGTYTASGSYRTPESVETINVSITISSNVVTTSSVAGNAVERVSAAYISDFENSYKRYVTGKKLSDIQLSRVSGSSLTSNGFNAALIKIKAEAASS